MNTDDGIDISSIYVEPLMLSNHMVFEVFLIVSCNIDCADGTGYRKS